ncbi:MAG: hypothetical protein IPI13_04880 [Actinomycetales bacterium]|uniref:Uncharacterized protein n=1 Tax=Candidatus Phosphoribacter hodrii TaxID=2953743 RepID=A0A935IU22_9MICO|nr:hypothetical protein [Candidatus Phosphoribacter hodrii]
MTCLDNSHDHPGSRAHACHHTDPTCPVKFEEPLIFSSHNANLVVNGDADLVLVCAYVNAGDQSAGHIKEQGAIDVAAVRSQITTVMEGGEKAFRLRKEKYGF